MRDKEQFMYSTNNIIGHNIDVLFDEEADDGHFFESVSISHPGSIMPRLLINFIMIYYLFINILLQSLLLSAVHL